ncbi:MAG TPA: DNA repair protein RecN [Pseudogracilibacillus sp.]|nr:DNA repair protein RecN [Pseudogracilibacillus sp.]
MLTELSIKNFAIIDNLSVHFQEGLTVLTGETGAGKSIIIDAVNLLSGGRGSVDYIRHGANKAELSGLFTIDNNTLKIINLAEKYGIDIEDNMVILERTITNMGKSICRINGKIVTLIILREFGHNLVDIHSQHDTYQLMSSSAHINLLDSFNSEDIIKSKLKYDEVYKELSHYKQEYNNLTINEQETAQRLDLYLFQANELKEAGLEVDEDIQLEEEKTKLANFEKIYLALEETYHALQGDQKGLEWLNIAQTALQNGADYDNFIKEKTEELTSLFFNIEELSFQIRDYKDQIQFNEARLNEVESRLSEIARLKKKYGTTVNEIIDYYHEVQAKIKVLENKDVHNEQLERKIEKLTHKTIEIGKKLRKERKKTAKMLIQTIQLELKDLYLENAKFEVEFNQLSADPSEDINENGLDKINFLLSTNLGEPLKRLDKVASGGELSRIMLILKKIFVKHQNISTVIFDEIDTGVSGRVAQAIAEKMYDVSINSQTLCITHLPQVAAMSDQYLLIKKEETKNRTITKISELTRANKVKELSQMMTGTKMTESAMNHSTELVNLSDRYKQLSNKKT